MITYPNAVDENGTVHNIGTITESNRSEHKFYCLGCGKEMVPVLFKQQDRTCHFRHKVNESCNQETYLHNLAKKILARRFKTQPKFEVSYYVHNECPQKESCKIFGLLRGKECSGITLRTVDLKEFYDTCEIEGAHNGFRADILLTNSHNPNIQPLFLEVAVSHECTQEKLDSGCRIIEMKVQNESEILHPIVENTGPYVPQKKVLSPISPYRYDYRVEPVSSFIKFHNFDQDRQQNNLKLMDRFAVLGDGRIVVQRRSVKCGEIGLDHLDDSVFELIALHPGEIDKNAYRNTPRPDFYEFALYHAVRYRIPIRYCSYCRHYYGRCTVPVDCEQRNFKTGEVEIVKRPIRNSLIADSKIDRNNLALRCKNWNYIGPRRIAPRDYAPGTFFIWMPSGKSCGK